MLHTILVYRYILCVQMLLTSGCMVIKLRNLKITYKDNIESISKVQLQKKKKNV